MNDEMKKQAIMAALTASELAFGFVQAAADALPREAISEEALTFFRDTMKAALSSIYAIDMVDRDDPTTADEDADELKEIINEVTRLQGIYLEASAKDPNIPRGSVMYIYRPDMGI